MKLLAPLLFLMDCCCFALQSKRDQHDHRHLLACPSPSFILICTTPTTPCRQHSAPSLLYRLAGSAKPRRVRAGRLKCCHCDLIWNVQLEEIRCDLAELLVAEAELGATCLSNTYYRCAAVGCSCAGESRSECFLQKFAMALCLLCAHERTHTGACRR